MSGQLKSSLHLPWQRRRALAAATALLAMPCAAQPATSPLAPDAAASAAAQAVPAAGAASSPASSPADDEAALRERFSKWVAAFRATALAAGIRENTFDAAFDGVQVLPRVIERDRTQPEFARAVWDYLESAVLATRITRGQDKLAQARAEAEAAAARHGVPAPVLAAIWGIESNYGNNVGSAPTASSAPPRATRCAATSAARACRRTAFRRWSCCSGCRRLSAACAASAAG